jgi:kumamolisin
MSKSHVRLPGSKRSRNTDAIRVGPVNPKERMEVTIGLRGPKLPDADEVLTTPLSQEEFEARFSSMQEDAAEVAKALKKFKLKVEEISLSTRSMRVSGTVKAMETAFQQKFAMYRAVDQGEYRGREGSVMIPSELRGIVTGVFGLDQRKMAERKGRGDAPAHTSKVSLAPRAPSDLESLYNFPPGDGTGQSIAIAEFGGGYIAEDVEAFCAKFKLSPPTVRAISVNIPAYTLSQIKALPTAQRKEQLADSMEVTMDVQIIVGLCPRANISVYFASFDQKGWIDLLTQVIRAKPVTLAISWGLAEDDPGWSANAVKALNDRLNVARLLGIAVCVASGDDGSGDQMDDGKAHVDFPSSSPFVLGVGGTMLQGTGEQLREITWWESPGRRTSTGGGSSGGGVSAIFKRPKWQTVKITSLNAKSIDGRVVPDVAALAGPPLYDLFFLAEPFPDGGTSASAPLWAALIARINGHLPLEKQQRFITPLLYQSTPNGAPLGKVATRDITSGNNASSPSPGNGYKAGPGFDAVTGWGVPDGVKLLEALRQL